MSSGLIDAPANGCREEKAADAALPKRVLPLSAKAEECEQRGRGSHTSEDQGENDGHSLRMSASVSGRLGTHRVRNIEIR